jgi:hypothetical protein
LGSEALLRIFSWVPWGYCFGETPCIDFLTKRSARAIPLRAR